MSTDNLPLHYYDAEMRYLREAGHEFAQAFPDRAAQLNLDKPGASDPYVERLFEGFAFLMGRLREKLDDDLPELTEGLVSLLWPHYLRTIPSLAIVEVTPEPTQIKRNELLASGFEVLSQPIGAQRTRCRYTTTQDLTLRPLTLDSLRLDHEPDGRSLLRLQFRFGTQIDWNLVDLSRVPLYLNADAALASALHQALTLNAQALYVRVSGEQQRRRFAGHFAPKGFAEEDRLWPKGDSAFSGYQLLLEYFTFREKFMFVTLCGLEKLELAPGTSGFDLEVVLNEHWPQAYNLSAEHLRLHAVPVINLFKLESDPMALDPLQTDYLLRPMRLQDGHIEIYSVDEVTALESGTRHEYVPFSSFRHKGGMLRDEAPERYFHIHLFGEMLQRFFALYADIHLYNQLTLILQPSGKCLRWNENHSQRIPG